MPLYIMFCRSLFVPFLLSIVLSVLQITDSEYPFGIFKFFLHLNIYSYFLVLHSRQNMSARGTNSDFDQQIYNVHENSLKTHQSRIQVDAALRQMQPWFMRPCIMRPCVNRPCIKWMFRPWDMFSIHTLYAIIHNNYANSYVTLTLGKIIIKKISFI